jgi:group I intron endonuclease
VSYSGFVYKWTNKKDGMMYIGSHKGSISDGYIGSGVRFLNAVDKYGIESFERDILEFVLHEDNIFKREQYYLDKFNCGKSDKYYNISSCAVGGSGYGEDNPFYGKTHTEEAKYKIGSRTRGTKLSQEYKDKISNSLKGRTFSKKTKKLLSIRAKERWKSEEEREIYRKRNLGKKLSEETKEKLRQKNLGKKQPRTSCVYCRKEVSINNITNHQRSKRCSRKEV